MDVLSSETFLSKIRNLGTIIISLSPFFLFSFIVILVGYVLNVIEGNYISNKYVDIFKDIDFEGLNPSFTELYSRLRWGISVLLVATSNILLISVIIIYLLKNRFPKYIFLLTIYLSSLPILFVLLHDTTYEFNKLFLDTTVYRLARVKQIVAAVEASGHASLFGIAIILSAQLYQALIKINRKTHENFDSVVKDIAFYYKSTRVLLYFATFSLIAGTLQSAALYSWAESLFTETNYFIKGDNFVSAMSALTGALYSLLIASIFLPALFLLKYIAGTLADFADSASVPERSEWLSNNYLNISIPNQILSVLSILAPLLIGGPGISLIQILGN